MKMGTIIRAAIMSAAGFGPSILRAWDYEGHRIVNQVALAALPADFPAFVRVPDNAERIAFLAGEPDRWRNVSDTALRSTASLEHFINIEEFERAGLEPSTVPALRYEFATAYTKGRTARAGQVPKIDPARDTDRTREWPGFLPWAIVEHYHKLRSAFSSLRAYEQSGGTATEIANARENAIYIMGVLGHYVGDGAQPLHTTIHFYGWTGANPRGFTTADTFHSWIDGGFMRKVGITADALKGRVGPVTEIPSAQRSAGRDPVFVWIMNYLMRQHRLVEPLYQLEKGGHFNRDERPADVQGRDFIEAQLINGGQVLAALWLTAWRTAPPDTFLEAELARRARSGARKN